MSTTENVNKLAVMQAYTRLPSDGPAWDTEAVQQVAAEAIAVLDRLSTHLEIAREQANIVNARNTLERREAKLAVLKEVLAKS